jgi:hypothetical protein
MHTEFFVGELIIYVSFVSKIKNLYFLGRFRETRQQNLNLKVI